MLNIIHKTLVGGLLLLLSFFSQANDASPLRVGIDLTYAPYAYLLILNVRSKLIFSLIYKLEAFLLSEVTIAFLHKN